MQYPEPDPKKRAVLNRLLKLEGTVLIFGGAFMLLKEKFSAFVLLDVRTDFYIGFTVFSLGIVNLIIADKFFPTGNNT